jgi:hypothetical protein
MRNELILSLSVFSLSELRQLKLGTLSADNLNVDPNPLEEQAEGARSHQRPFPTKNFMKTKAVVTVTPELRYGYGLVAKGQSSTFRERRLWQRPEHRYQRGGRTR